MAGIISGLSNPGLIISALPASATHTPMIWILSGFSLRRKIEKSIEKNGDSLFSMVESVITILSIA